MPVIGTASDTLVLIRDSDRGAADYKAGDIVQVFAGTESVTLPPAAPFYLILVTGLTFEQALQYQAAAYNEDGSLRYKRIFQIRINQLPKAYRDLLASQRWFSVAWTDVQPYVENKLGV